MYCTLWKSLHWTTTLRPSLAIFNKRWTVASAPFFGQLNSTICTFLFFHPGPWLLLIFFVGRLNAWTISINFICEWPESVWPYQVDWTWPDHEVKTCKNVRQYRRSTTSCTCCTTDLKFGKSAAVAYHILRSSVFQWTQSWIADSWALETETDRSEAGSSALVQSNIIQIIYRFSNDSVGIFFSREDSKIRLSNSLIRDPFCFVCKNCRWNKSLILPHDSQFVARVHIVHEITWNLGLWA